jgi:hypothetical protein
MGKSTTDALDMAAALVAGLSSDSLERALKFYCQSPDGQYDLEVAVPLIASELLQRKSGRAGGDVLASTGSG